MDPVIQEAASFIRSRIREIPRTALVLGSGLGSLADELQDPVVIPYGEIPHFPAATAPGHAGRLLAGRLEGTPVLMMQGRFHRYEGHEPSRIVFPVRVLKCLGVARLLVQAYIFGMLALIYIAGAIQSLEARQSKEVGS